MTSTTSIVAARRNYPICLTFAHRQRILRNPIFLPRRIAAILTANG
jgi:hypothetical protein